MGIWSVLYAPIVVGYLEFVICPFCSGVCEVCYKVVGYIEHDIKKVVYGLEYVCVLESPIIHYSRPNFNLHMDCRSQFVFKMMDVKNPTGSNMGLAALSTTYFIDGASVVMLENLELSSIMFHWISSVS